ncbi:S-adenosylmethionine decarboxylase proenzyme [Hypsizygus marmoreus]|uniref:adenosylmethionine decarboxylase n=1 Tax=Hypsizygus marmoreus TaxID=39966 RepID=A0A369K0F0_HYPMA|nr:S-adenosylmethionine decarboxylase proenzyme [Hypsizygus marmoreus]
MAQDILDDPHSPFEGPEKLLEIWFKPSANDVPDAANASADSKIGLRKVDRKIWEEMLDIVKCEVLSVVNGTEMDAYLLSESSFFVFPHRLILKTCGTTLNLYGLPRILEIAATEANLPSVHRCFYSRKSFMFPERQLGPHRDWKQEVEYLDNIFDNGSAYTVGKVNGDHWLLYLTNPEDGSSETAPSSPIDTKDDDLPDYTIEILMSDLAAPARDRFFSSLSPADDPHEHGTALSETLGISEIFPSHLTTIDAYSFSPCGYSANALVKWGGELSHLSTSSESLHDDHDGATNGTASLDDFREGYYTIHVTPEAGWSYASFECNIPSHMSENTHTVPGLISLVQRVVSIFKPGRLSLTLFISIKDEVEPGESVEAAQKAFKLALTDPGLVHGFSCAKVNGGLAQGISGTRERAYKRTDKINYEFGGYELAFASFELKA